MADGVPPGAQRGLEVVVHRFADLHPASWKNGGGTTREVAGAPPSRGLDDFYWRVSFADVDTSGPFSEFPGVDRVLMLVEGATMRLTVDGVVHDLGPGEPFRFAGEARTAGDLPAGPTRDLNIMTRRDRCLARVTVRTFGDGEAVAVVGAEPALLVVLNGRAALRPGDAAPISLDPLDVAQWVGPAGVTVCGSGTVAVVEISALGADLLAGS